MRVFSTGQLAKIFKVYRSTVCEWIDSGKMKGWRTPRSKVRRTCSDYAIEFARRHVGVNSRKAISQLLDDGITKILIVAQDQILIENIRWEFPLERSCRVETAMSGFGAGIKVADLCPDVVIVILISSPAGSWTKSRSIIRDESRLLVCEEVQLEFSPVVLYRRRVNLEF